MKSVYTKILIAFAAISLVVSSIMIGVITYISVLERKKEIGIGLRVSGLAPERFIAVFYTGLGASLLAAGLLFGCNYGKAVFAD